MAGLWRTGTAMVWLATLLCWLAAPAFAVDVNPPLPTGTIVIGDRVTVTVELARSGDEKVRGLSGRPGLKRGTGMLFVYDRPQPIGIWMKDMRFSLDILWIREGRVVHIERNAPPLTAVGPERVYTATGEMVLELPAGFAADRKIKVGDSVKADIPK
jgi:uncharacterized protein